MSVAIDRSGRGVRIAIVDTGVDRTHPWLRDADIRHFAVRPNEGKFVVVPAESHDASGHGTACAGIVHRMTGAATIIDVCALDDEGRCPREALLAAIRHCIVERYEVVNLSLGIDVARSAALNPTEHATILSLYELADAAYTRGVVLVAAGPNVGALRTYPGKFKSLIGVGRAAFGTSDGLRTAITADHEILAPGESILAPALGGGERHWTGTSFAVPHVAAHVARIRSARASLSIDAIRAALHALAFESVARAEESACAR